MDSIRGVEYEPSVGLFVLKHDTVSRFDSAVFAEGPWHLGVGSLKVLLTRGVGKYSSGLLNLIVGLLDGSNFHVFVPVADSGLVGVLGSSLQLLGSVLHDVTDAVA